MPYFYHHIALWQYAHVLCGALVTGGFIVAGVGAYYTLAQRDEPFGRAFLQHGILVACLFSALTIFPTGDRNGADITTYQPLKLAAAEGLFHSERGAPLALIGMPDVKRRLLLDPVVVPSALSFLAYGNFNANVRGLETYPTDLWPPVELTYYAYHVMVGLGTIFIGIGALAALFLWRGRLERAHWLLWLILLCVPFPYIANEAGWVVAEVGRQPWIVYGLLKTTQGISSNVSAGEALFTLIGFMGMYFLLGTTFLFLSLRQIGKGPA